MGLSIKIPYHRKKDLEHIAPEILAGQTMTPSCDMYSLGVLMEMCLKVLEKHGFRDTIPGVTYEIADKATCLQRGSFQETGHLLAKRILPRDPHLKKSSTY